MVLESDYATNALVNSADKAASSSDSSSGLLNALTGLLSKAADTAIDVIGIQQAGKTLGSVYPTGQVNPAALTSQQSSTGTSVFNWKPWAIGGGVVLAALIGLAVVTRRK